VADPRSNADKDWKQHSGNLGIDCLERKIFLFTAGTHCLLKLAFHLVLDRLNTVGAYGTSGTFHSSATGQESVRDTTTTQHCV
jgi:hypothetical protein